MKFNEKLIDLRKKAGLSQEELGYKLNVTRQTVSKWELGETTPEMAKLVEMSRIFNVSVDELTNESEISTNVNPIIEDKPIQDKPPKSNKVLIIIVALLIVVIVGIIGKFAMPFMIGNKIIGDVFSNQGVEQEATGFFERISSLLNKALDQQEEVLENLDNSNEDFENIKDGVENLFGDATNKINASAFNGALELYNGSNTGIQLKSLLEKVITSNKKEDRKITVKYNEIETQDTNEIQNLKMSFKDSNNFEVTFDYDQEGYIYKVTIQRVFSEIEKKSFNSVLEMYSGSKMGGHVTALLDKIITSNKTEDRIITVKYNQKETQDENEIKNIKQNIGTFNNYDVTLEYDADGFVNKAIIEKL